MDHIKMNKKRRGGFCLRSAALLAAFLLGACVTGCGKAEPGSPEEPESSVESAVTAVSSTAAQTSASEAPSAAASSAAGGIDIPEGPEEDPRAEGYFYDEALTEALRAAFVTENTNNTDESSLSRTMTEEHLWQLNETAQTWLYENISDSEAEELLMLKTFHFSDDTPGTERGMRTAKAAVYLLRGNDPETLHSRILLGNTEPCFYLFLRAYYSEAENRTRVYMINGLVW